MDENFGTCHCKSQEPTELDTNAIRNIKDVKMRLKLVHMQQNCPNISLGTLKTALEAKGRNYGAAMDYLAAKGENMGMSKERLHDIKYLPEYEQAYCSSDDCSSEGTESEANSEDARFIDDEPIVEEATDDSASEAQGEEATPFHHHFGDYVLVNENQGHLSGSAQPGDGKTDSESDEHQMTDAP